MKVAKYTALTRLGASAPARNRQTVVTKGSAVRHTRDTLLRITITLLRITYFMLL